MPNRIQLLRSITPGARPSSKVYGEPYVNFGDNQLGVFDSSNAARDLIGVPIFSAAKAYSVGNMVNNSGLLYIANTSISPGTFNPVQWIPVTPSTAAPQPNLFNGKLVESHTANSATFTVQTLAGGNPSLTNPVGIYLPNGSILWITAALSLTIPSSAAFGTVSNQPFRLWFVVVSNSGTPVLGVQRCSSGGVGLGAALVNGFDGRGIETANLISGSTNPLILYSSSAFTNQPYCVIGYADYDVGLPTPGAWSASPTRIVLSTGSIPLPGSIIQTQTYNFGPQATNITSATFAFSIIQCSFLPTSPCNLVQFFFTTDVDCIVAGGSQVNIKASRMPTAGGTTVDISPTFSNQYSSGSYPGQGQFSIKVSDYPGLTAAQTYGLRIAMSPATSGVNGAYVPINAAWAEGMELMG